MGTRGVVVAGAGFAGLAGAVLLARDGHRVTLLDRDPFEVAEPLAAWEWRRRGIPHFLQPHAFIPRGRKDLRELLPDVDQSLRDAGAHDVDLCAKRPGPAAPGDEDLQFLAVRRPLIEWALRRAVAAEPKVTVRGDVAVRGLRIEAGRVTGVETDGGLVAAEVVVDALGRRSPTPDWLAQAGLPESPLESSDCGVSYYCRYYRQRPGFDLPDGPWPLSPRGDLGYLGFSTFPGDNRTFAALFAVPPGVPEWRAFREAAVFEAAVAQVPLLRPWVDPSGVEPITDVLPMAGLRNTLRHYDPARSRGLAPMGDALAHTDPVLSLGLPFALIQAAELAAGLRDHDDVDAALAQYAERTAPEIRERFDLATSLDEQRYRMWIGEPVDLSGCDGDYALFTFVAGATAAARDPDVFRAFYRRMGMLDRTGILDSDVAMQRRIEEVFGEMRATPRPPSGPSREEMVDLMHAR